MMATRVETLGAKPPTYQSHELTILPRASTSTSPPPYEDVPTPTSTPTSSNPSALSEYPGLAPFRPTHRLRIDARGQAALRLPCPPRPDPIPIYDVTGGDAGAGQEPLYVSLRAERGSGTCRLIKGSTFSTGGEGYGGGVEGEGGQEVLCTTTYRFGPGRPPVITLNGSDGYADDGENDSAEDIVIESAGTFTRTQTLRTPHGTFRWRYASSKERSSPSHPQSQSHPQTGSQPQSQSQAEPQTGPQPQPQDSILILEKLTTISPAYPPTSSHSPFHREKTEQIPTEIARLVRGPGTRTEGTARSDAGNGGLLLLNLADWAGEKRGREEEEVRVLIVASCVAMLKKEVDRRRGVQAAVMVSVLSGS